MFKLLLSALLVVISASLASAQSRIVTTSGNVFIGSILDEDKSEISIRTADGIDIKVPRDKIESISYGRTQTVVQDSQPAIPQTSQLREAEISKDGGTVSAGISLGNHGDAGLNIGYHDNGYTARATGIGWDDGALLVQGSLMKGLISTGPMSINAGLISGYLWFSGDYSYRGIPTSDVYAGPAVSLSVLGMYSEIGYTYGFGQKEGAYLLYQVGYAYHF